MKVLLKQKFAFAYQSQGEYLLSTMPVQFLCPKDLKDNDWEFDPTKSCDLIGSAVCEANGTNDLSTSFFSSSCIKPG